MTLNSAIPNPMPTTSHDPAMNLFSLTQIFSSCHIVYAFRAGQAIGPANLMRAVITEAPTRVTIAHSHVSPSPLVFFSNAWILV